MSDYDCPKVRELEDLRREYNQQRQAWSEKRASLQAKANMLDKVVKAFDRFQKHVNSLNESDLHNTLAEARRVMEESDG